MQWRAGWSATCSSKKHSLLLLGSLIHSALLLPPSTCPVRAQAKLAQADSGAQRMAASPPPWDGADGARQPAGTEAAHNQQPRPGKGGQERLAPPVGRDARAPARAVVGAMKERKSGGAAVPAPARVKEKLKPGLERRDQDRGPARGDREGDRPASRKPSHPKARAHAGAKRPALNTGNSGTAAPAPKRARQASFSSSSSSESSLCGEPPPVRSGPGAGAAGTSGPLFYFCNLDEGVPLYFMYSYKLASVCSALSQYA